MVDARWVGVSVAVVVWVDGVADPVSVQVRDIVSVQTDVVRGADPVPVGVVRRRIQRTGVAVIGNGVEITVDIWSAAKP